MEDVLTNTKVENYIVNLKSFQLVHMGTYNRKDVKINYLKICLNQYFEDLLHFISHFPKSNGSICVTDLRWFDKCHITENRNKHFNNQKDYITVQQEYQKKWNFLQSQMKRLIETNAITKSILKYIFTQARYFTSNDVQDNIKNTLSVAIPLH